MPPITKAARTGARLLAGAVGLALLCASPASAAEPAPVKPVKGAASNPLGCTVAHALSNPFSAFGDSADYALAPGGDFESGAAGWKLIGAGVTAGNQPFDIGTGGRSSLRLPTGATAISPPMCIDASYPHFRMLARNTGGGKGALKAEVLFLDQKGNVKASASGNVASRGTGWFPTSALQIGVTFDTTVAGGAAPVAFRFTAPKDTAWQIDDLYVDPRLRR